MSIRKIEKNVSFFLATGWFIMSFIDEGLSAKIDIVISAVFSIGYVILDRLDE